MRQDYSKAIGWYQNLANQNNSLAKYNLGLMYEYGKGVIQKA
ncbi:hypothetical protein [Psychrobacter urativorans]|nr:hypothetical protein [Psychrobacter urativorans]